MTRRGAIPLSAHGAIEVVAGPAIMIAPFALGFGTVASAICVAVGAILLGLSLQLEGPRRTIPLSAHASLEYALAVVAVAAGIGLAIAADAASEAAFLVGIGVAQAMLTATTRFSAARNA